MARYMEVGWLKGNLVRRARKPHQCNYWMGLQAGGRCRHIIQPGEEYAEGDANEEAGGFGCDRICMKHASEQLPEVAS